MKLCSNESLNSNIDFKDDAACEKQIREDIDRHELLQQYIAKYDTVTLCYRTSAPEDAVAVFLPFTLIKAEEALAAVIKGTETNTIPDAENTLVIEEGFCHTANVMEKTKDLPIPDDLVEYNFMYAKEADRCGCCHCGSIFHGSEVTDCTRDSRGDIVGTAFCPKCGMDAVIVEKDDVAVTENNLWRWFLHMFSDKPM